MDTAEVGTEHHSEGAVEAPTSPKERRKPNSGSFGHGRESWSVQAKNEISELHWAGDMAGDMFSSAMREITLRLYWQRNAEKEEWATRKTLFKTRSTVENLRAEIAGLKRIAEGHRAIGDRLRSRLQESDTELNDIRTDICNTLQLRYPETVDTRDVLNGLLRNYNALKDTVAALHIQQDEIAAKLGDPEGHAATLAAIGALKSKNEALVQAAKSSAQESRKRIQEVRIDAAWVTVAVGLMAFALGWIAPTVTRWVVR